MIITTIEDIALAGLEKGEVSGRAGAGPVISLLLLLLLLLLLVVVVVCVLLLLLLLL